MKKITVGIVAALLLLVIVFIIINKIGNTSNSTSFTKTDFQVKNNNTTIGNFSAPVKIVEYADVLCPYCARINEETMPNIKNDYIKKDKLHYEMRLVAMISPDSQRAARGAYCAAEQGKFWEYIGDAYKKSWGEYYAHNKSPEDVPYFQKSNIRVFAGSLGLGIGSWQQCMQSNKYADLIEENAKSMQKLNAQGTPYFIINNQGYGGAPPYPVFKATIDAELRKVNVN